MVFPPKEQRPYNIELLRSFQNLNRSQLDDMISALATAVEINETNVEDYRYVLEEARKLLRQKFTS